MNTFIEKSFDLVTKSAKKLPLAFMLLLIFTLLFPMQGKSIIMQSLTLFSSVLPDSLNVFFSGITLKYVINFFGATLIIFLISIIWEISFKAYQGQKSISLEMNILFELNSIGLISLIIYNKTSNSPVSIYTINNAIEPSTIYLFALLLSFFTFILIFSTIYLFFLWAIFMKICEIKNIKLRVIMIFLFFFLLSKLLNYISKEVVQSTLGSIDNIM